MTHPSVCRGRNWLSLSAIVGLIAMSAGAALDLPKLETAINQAASWQHGNDAGPLKTVSAAAFEAAREPADARALEALLIRAVDGTATAPAKAFFCRQLLVVGSGQCVPSLAALLKDPQLSHPARCVLERMRGQACDDALSGALPPLDDQLKIGVLHSLGRRGNPAAAPAVIAQLSSTNADVVWAAVHALRRMPAEQAVSAVTTLRPKLKGRLRIAADETSIELAGGLAARGETARAVAIYEELCKPGERSMCRIAALGGLVACQGSRGVALAIAALGDQDIQVRQAAIPMLRVAAGPQATRAIAAELAKHPPEIRLLLLDVLADRGDPAAVADVLPLTKSPEAEVRCAATEALGRMGNASVVPQLAQLAATWSGREQRVARASLDGLRAEGVDRAIVAQLASADAAVRRECARSLGVRRTAESVADILKLAGSGDVDVAQAALKSLRVLAGAEQVPALVSVLVKMAGGGAAREAEEAVVVAAKRASDVNVPAKTVQAASDRATGPAKVSLVTVLGRICGEGTLPRLLTAANDRDPEVQLAAIRGLAAWPTPAPATTLRTLAQDTARSDSLRVIALRGYIAQIGLHDEATDEEVLTMYADAIAMAQRPDEKKSVLSELSQMRHEGALALAKQSLADPALKDAAAQAVKKIEKALAAPALVTASVNAENAKNAIDGNPGTRWDTGAAMAGGEWFLLDLGQSETVTKLVLDTKGSPGDYPRGYEIYVAANTRGKGKLVAQGQGATVTRITFNPPVTGRLIRIVQTGKSDGLYWSIHELTVEQKK